MATATLLNAPSKFDMANALLDDKEVSFRVRFENGEERTVTVEVWGLTKRGRNGYHGDIYDISGILQDEGNPLPLDGNADVCWSQFQGQYNMRSRQGELLLELD